jgi:hypothetical protein
LAQFFSDRLADGCSDCLSIDGAQWLSYNHS